MQKVATVLPSYKSKSKILSVLEQIGPEVHGIFVVDDACPEGTGKTAQSECKDPRVQVIFMPENRGVGGATLAGFMKAQQLGYSILVKLDSDGQMNPKLIPKLIKPILEGQCDFTKGNRFFSAKNLQSMPRVRFLGNAGLSFLSKVSTGYWNIMDPTNGFLAMHASLLLILETDKISQRYFFESDLLFRLGLLRAVVKDIPMTAVYGSEKSNLSVSHSLLTFPGKIVVRTLKRIVYQYFLRDFNVVSVLFLSGLLLFLGGFFFGAYHWFLSYKTGQIASSGTVMVSALPLLLGFQMLTFCLLFDVVRTPTEPLHPHLD